MLKETNFKNYFLYTKEKVRELNGYGYMLGT